jgi:membrane-associated phospholipid phosphatase
MILFYAILAYIGFWGPLILMGLSICILSRLPFRQLGAYGIGQLGSSLVNYVAKGLIRQPRPSSETVHYFTWDSFEDRFHKANRMGVQEYGMPSGHAQSVFFSLMFMHYAVKNDWLTFFYFCIAIITAVQRIIYKNHSLEQVITGGIIGGCLGYLAWIYLPDWVGWVERRVFNQY